jgi:hypothetical protein
MALFNEFHEDKLPLYRLNFGIITLLPKTGRSHTYKTIPTYLLAKYEVQDIHQSGS